MKVRTRFPERNKTQTYLSALELCANASSKTNSIENPITPENYVVFPSSYHCFHDVKKIRDMTTSTLENVSSINDQNVENRTIIWYKTQMV